MLILAKQKYNIYEKMYDLLAETIECQELIKAINQSMFFIDEDREDEDGNEDPYYFNETRNFLKSELSIIMA